MVCRENIELLKGYVKIIIDSLKTKTVYYKIATKIDFYCLCLTSYNSETAVNSDFHHLNKKYCYFYLFWSVKLNWLKPKKIKIAFLVVKTLVKFILTDI